MKKRHLYSALSRCNLLKPVFRLYIYDSDLKDWRLAKEGSFREIILEQKKLDYFFSSADQKFFVEKEIM